MSRNAFPILVEFVGLPGSGKTTIAAAFRKALIAEGMSARDCNAHINAGNRTGAAIRRVLTAAAYALHNPSLAWRGGQMVYATRQSVNDYRAVFTNWLCKCDSMQQCSTPGIHVADEGVLHALWSIAYRAGSTSHLAESAARLVHKCIPDRWIIVEVEASRPLTSERLLSRPGKPNRLARDTSSRADAWEAAAVAMDVVHQAVKRLDRGNPGSLITIRLPNPSGQPPSVIASELRRQLLGVPGLGVPQ